MFEEREKVILSLLEDKDTVSVKELAGILNVSEMTIRRDLQSMEKKGVIKRVFGGAAKIKGLHLENPLPIRANRLPEAKRKIARLACNLIAEGDVISLDVGTTIIELAKQVAKRDIVVITPSIQAGLYLAKGSAKVYLTGGEIRSEFMSLVGSIAEQAYKNMYVDKAFIGAAGINLEGGITDYSEDEARIKRLMMERAREVILLIDNTKFDVSAFIKVADLQQVHLIVTNVKPPLPYLKACQESQTKVIWEERQLAKTLVKG
ncbi:MAG: DeoR family transcriptional regulator, fructose operon transcriptional repressor [Clostridia bacterium]|nr:DeoR family transcriptional regulator, fructose operon transcriptional repressor [Clostridia bacterium]